MTRSLSMLFLHFACSVILQAKIGDMRAVFSSDMFPYLNNYTLINSSAIEINWHPSPGINGIDLTELVGVFTMAAYATSRSHISIHRAMYAMTALNEAGKLILTDLKANTIYSVRFERDWQGSGTNRIILRDTGSKLIRTYAKGKWNQYSCITRVEEDNHEMNFVLIS